MNIQLKKFANIHAFGTSHWKKNIPYVMMITHICQQEALPAEGQFFGFGILISEGMDGGASPVSCMRIDHTHLTLFNLWRYANDPWCNSCQEPFTWKYVRHCEIY